METEVIHADPEEGDVYMEGANEGTYGHIPDGKGTYGHGDTDREPSIDAPCTDTQYQMCKIESSHEDREVDWVMKYDKLSREHQASTASHEQLQSDSYRKQNAMQQELSTLENLNAAQTQCIMKLQDTVSRERSRYSVLYDTNVSQHKEYTTLIGNLKSRITTLEEEKISYQSQLEKMSQIISELQSKGLPLPPDDNFFVHELNSLIADTRQWARLFTKGQEPLTLEVLKSFHLSEANQSRLGASFASLRNLLALPSFGRKLRTRCVEAILLRTFTGRYLYRRYMGKDKDSHRYYQDCISSLCISDQEKRYWAALTNHLLTKDNDEFQKRQIQEVDELTEELYSQISPFGGGSSRATKQGLRALVSRVGKLGLEIAKLPFILSPYRFRPGERFEPNTMELDEDHDSGDENGEISTMKTTIVLCQPYLKLTFDSEGRVNEIPEDPKQWIIFSKARVSCIA